MLSREWPTNREIVRYAFQPNKIGGYWEQGGMAGAILPEATLLEATLLEATLREKGGAILPATLRNLKSSREFSATLQNSKGCG